MSGTPKTIVGAAVVLVLIILGFWFFGSKSSTPASAPVTTTNTPQATTPTPTPSGNVVTNPSDTSDASIDQDLTNVDAQLSGMSGDNASVDSSLNDKSVQ